MVMGEAPAGARSALTAWMPALRTRRPLVGPEEEPRWGEGQHEGPARRTLCGPSSNPFSRNIGWGWLRSLWKCMGQRNRKHRGPLRNTFA